MNQRRDCSYCGYQLTAETDCVEVPCHVRAHAGERFRVWRCPTCQSIHCLDKVDLDYYYTGYPTLKGKRPSHHRWFFRNLCHRFTQNGYSPTHKLLDYGCGEGHFVKYLRRHGYPLAHGYDPYASRETFGNRDVLTQGPFDYILLQDVIEHVEDPRALLAELDGYLAPGGQILIATPNAAKINLSRPQEFLDEIHVPYHLHIYDRPRLETLARDQGWVPTAFFDRPYYDLPWFGMNWRVAREYRRLLDDCIDVYLERPRVLTALSSIRFWFYGLVGYWSSFRPQMAILFRKQQEAATLPASRAA